MSREPIAPLYVAAKLCSTLFASLSVVSLSRSRADSELSCCSGGNDADDYNGAGSLYPHFLRPIAR